MLYKFINAPLWIKGLTLLAVLTTFILIITWANKQDFSQHPADTSSDYISKNASPTPKSSSDASPTTSPTVSPTSPTVTLPAWYGNMTLSKEDELSAGQASVNAVTQYYTASADETVDQRNAKVAPLIVKNSPLLLTTPAGDQSKLKSSDGSRIDSECTISNAVVYGGGENKYAVRFLLNISVLLTPPSSDNAQRPQIVKGNTEVDVQMIKVGNDWLMESVVEK